MLTPTQVFEDTIRMLLQHATVDEIVAMLRPEARDSFKARVMRIKAGA